MKRAEIKVDKKKLTTVKAMDEATNEAVEVRIPEMLYEGRVLYKDTAFVDYLEFLTYAYTSMYQKGDNGFVSVSSNVKGEDSLRIIGQYKALDNSIVNDVINNGWAARREVVENEIYQTAYFA